MKRIFLFLFFLVTALHPFAKGRTSPKEFARKIVEKVRRQLEYNKTHPGSKVHIINISDIDNDENIDNPTHLVEKYVNNGGSFWNLSDQDKTDINNYIDARQVYDSTLYNIDYIIVIGSIFKYDDVGDLNEDIDWSKVQQAKAKSNVSALTDDQKKFFSSLKKDISANFTFPQGNFLVNWYLSAFTKGSDNSNYRVLTESFLTNNSGVKSDEFGFASIDSKFNSASISKKDWILRNVDNDEYTLKYIRDRQINGYLVNISGGITTTNNDFLKQLLDGNATYTEHNTIYRNLKMILVVMDEQTTAKDREQALALTSSTRLIILLDFKNGRPTVTPKYPTEEMKLLFGNYINAVFDPRTFWEVFGDNIKGVGEEFVVFLYDGLDWLAKGIAKAKIPEHIWNCCNSDYDPKYATFFKTFLAHVITIFQGGGAAGEAIAQADFSGAFSNCPSFELTAAQFAFYAGVWDGLVDMVAAIPSGLSLLLSPMIDDAHKVDANGNPIRNSWGIMSDSIKAHGGGVPGFFRFIGSSLKQLHDPSFPCVFAHSIGSDAMNIVALYLTAGGSLAETVAGSAAKTFFEVIQKLDVIGQAIGKIGQVAGALAKYTVNVVVKPALNTVTEVLEITWREVQDATRPVFKVILQKAQSAGQYVAGNLQVLIQVWNATKQTFEDFDWSTVTTITENVKAADGSYVPIKFGLAKGLIYKAGSFANDLKENIKYALKTVVKDESGEVLQNEAGQGLAVIQKEGASDDQQVLTVVEDAGKYKNGVENFVDLIKARTDWLNNLKSKYGPFDIANFKPQGLEVTEIPEDIYNKMLAEYPSSLQDVKKAEYLQGLIKSGSTVPVVAEFKAGDVLYKIVPKDEAVSAFTPFFMSADEYKIIQSASGIEQKLGLPLGSHAVQYDIYKIVATSDAKAFESEIAKTVENGYVTTGGSKQMLVIDRTKWSAPQKVTSITPIP